MNYDCKREMGSAGVSLAVLGVPPGKSSPKKEAECGDEPQRTTTGRLAPQSFRQTNAIGFFQPSNLCKSLNMNNLQNNPLVSVKPSQTRSNQPQRYP